MVNVKHKLCKTKLIRERKNKVHVRKKLHIMKSINYVEYEKAGLGLVAKCLFYTVREYNCYMHACMRAKLPK